MYEILTEAYNFVRKKYFPEMYFTISPWNLSLTKFFNYFKSVGLDKTIVTEKTAPTNENLKAKFFKLF